MHERIDIVNIRFCNTSDPAQFRFNITVVNTGSKHVWISALYINGTDILPEIVDNGRGVVWNKEGALQSAEDGEYLIVVKESLTFAFRPNAQVVNSMAYKNLQSIVIATSRGITAKEQWHAG